MSTSQNGWSASPTLKLRPLVVNGVGFLPGIRDDDDVAYMLGYFAEQYAKRVEPLKNPGCWGFSYRADRNQSSDLSNHASGTAIDLNAPKHPNGVATSRTFTDAQIATVHRILAECHGALRWGGDYTHTVDAMHVEVNVSPAQLKKVVELMKAATNPVLPRRAAAGAQPRQIPKWTASFYHNDTPAGAGYHGLAAGRAKGYVSADMNFNACKPTLLHPNGVLVNTHWPRTGHDHFTSKTVTKNVAFFSLTWAQAKQLRNPAGYTVHSLGEIIKRAAKDGYTHLEIELKDGVDHLTHKQLAALVKKAERQAKRVGIQIYWKTLSNIGNPLKRVKAVHAGGGVSVLLPRESPHLKKSEWWPVLDYVRDGVGPNKVTWQ